MFIAATIAILVVMLIILLRAALGPTVFDRILAINTFGTATVLLIALFGFLTDRPDFMDIALLYALINFISTIAVLKLFRYGNLGKTPSE
ncbi:MAG: pH regulation protein F [Gammaproteobacteria bacterium]|nr:pH regulation protein F [Gammaproteobacteria bacterium]MBT8124947.1 pH regulation protein F [Gammaproteobacteria bacterium]NNC67789.1 pH regulation protein F [Gammaproteobacteria bacterium]